jgi:chromosome segregation protein
VQGRATAEARRAEVERRLAAAQVDLGRLEADLTVAAERLEHAATRTTRARGEREEARDRAQQAEREREAAAQERSAAQAARTSVQMELDLRAANEEEARARLTVQRERVRELENALQGEAETLRALQGERTATEREIAEVRAQETELAQRLAEAERDSRSARTRLEAARVDLGAREREQHEAAGELERTRHAFGAAREQEAAVRVEWRSAQEHLAQLEARREALDELERERAGLAPAARQLLQARQSFEPDAILGPLSDFIATSRAGAGLAERLLGDWIHAVLVRDQQVVEAVRRWHAETQPGPLVLLPVTPGPARAAEGTLPAGLEAVAPAEAWARTLVAGDAVLDQEGHSIRRSNGSVFLAADGGSGGLIGRRAELDDLRAELEGARARAAELEEAVQHATRDHAEAERAVAAAGARHERVRSVLHDAQGAHDDATRHLQRAERDRGEADVALARLRQRLEERATRQREIGAEQEGVARERARLEQELATQRSVLGDLDSAQEAARERRVHWQVEEAQVSAREVAAGERETRADAALADGREAMARLDQELEEIERERATLATRRAEWQDQLTERRVSVERLTAAAREAETGVTGADEALRSAEALVEEARTRLLDQREEAHRLDLAEAEVAARRRALVERIEAEWRKPLDELLAAAPEVAGDPAALREEAERLDQAIEALGPVNALAVEEHSEEAKRLDFLTTQRDDLVQARNSLLQAIREIDATARSMFVTTFASVQENFKTVFNTLFDGGECEVRLSDENDPLNCDIEIRAAPRGKRTQRIHLLSSGERTLVAISLLFAIYLTKPSPFCLLDEVDAPLDDANVARFVRLLNEFKPQTQFIVITHNPRTMQAADAVYGVTMQEPGVSTIVGVRLGEVEPV